MPEESQDQRWQRNFDELLQELRVAQTGVQILFAFLLTVGFSSGFAGADEFTRAVYLVALLAAAASTALIIAPVALHRALFRLGHKPEIVLSAHRFAVTGLAFMLIAMVMSVLLAADAATNRAAACVIAAVAAAWLASLWFALPLRQRAKAAAGAKATGGGKAAAGGKATGAKG